MRAEAGRWVVGSGAESTLEVLYAVDVWARRRRLDPAVWVEWNARRVRSVQTARERMLALFDEERAREFVEDTRAWSDAIQRQDRDLSNRIGESGFVVGRDMHYGAELAKWHFRQRGREILCIDAYDLHFGFHPQSDVCASCPLKDRCERETRMRIAKGPSA